MYHISSSSSNNYFGYYVSYEITIHNIVFIQFNSIQYYMIFHVKYNSKWIKQFIIIIIIITIANDNNIYSTLSFELLYYC